MVGKTASCAAMALTLGAYAAPELMRPLAVAAVVALVALNLRGIQRTAAATRVLVALVLGALSAVLVAALFGGQADAANLSPFFTSGVYGILQAGGLLFFAFAGYARIATLGEEVRDPQRTIPRAVPLALGITLVVYALVAAAALLAVGPQRLAAAEAPLAAAARAGALDWLAPAVRIGGALASLAVLLSLIAGVGRITLAMARERDLPGARRCAPPLPGAPPRRADHRGRRRRGRTGRRCPRGHRLQLVHVLAYYAIANACAWMLSDDKHRWPRWLAGLGVAGCLALAAALPPVSAAAGTGVLLIGAVGRALIRRRSHR